MGLSQDELNFLCNTLGHAIHASRGLALYRDRFPAHCEGQTLAVSGVGENSLLEGTSF